MVEYVESTMALSEAGGHPETHRARGLPGLLQSSRHLVVPIQLRFQGIRLDQIFAVNAHLLGLGSTTVPLVLREVLALTSTIVYQQ